MAIRKIYTSEDQELEIGWTKEGIHLFIKKEGVENDTHFIIEPYDIDDVLEDIQIYRDGVFDAKRELQKKEE
jgi:hypothetical protein